MMIRVLQDNILVKVTELPNTTASGIILTTKEIPCRGRVIASGPGKYLPDGTRDEHGIKVGDDVIFGASALQTPLEDHPDHFIMRAEQIYGKVDV